jgi:hypothetical protein
VPDNDACAAAAPLSRDEVLFFNSTGATTDGAPVKLPGGPPQDPLNYFPLGDTQVHHDVWYLLSAGSCNGTIAIDICDADFDTKAALYRLVYSNYWSFCETLDSPIAMNDDACGPDLGVQSRLITPVQSGGYGHLLRVGGYRGDFGSGEVSWSYIAPESSDLKTFAIWANCRRAACATQVCTPPLYATSCCLAQDFDYDGDVDLLDYRFIFDTLVGP